MTKLLHTKSLHEIYLYKIINNKMSQTSITIQNGQILFLSISIIF